MRLKFEAQITLLPIHYSISVFICEYLNISHTNQGILVLCLDSQNLGTRGKIIRQLALKIYTEKLGISCVMAVG